MQQDDDNQEDLADLAVCRAEHRVQVADEEGYRQAEADTDKDPVEDLQRGPADDGHGDPDQVGVAVESPALEEVG